MVKEQIYEFPEVRNLRSESQRDKAILQWYVNAAGPVAKEMEIACERSLAFECVVAQVGKGLWCYIPGGVIYVNENSINATVDGHFIKVYPDDDATSIGYRIIKEHSGICWQKYINKNLYGKKDDDDD